MIANHVGGHNLYVSGKGAWVMLLKAAENTKVVRTEPEIGLLNKIVDSLLRRITESARCSKGHRCDEPVESPDELLPRFRAA